MGWEARLVAERTRDYELVMVLSPEAAEEEVAAAVERVTEFITERGGEVSNHDTWGLRRLAYPIKRFQEGNYVLAHFSMDAAQLRELERSLIASEDVLRHLVTKVDKHSKAALADQPKPAPAEQPKPAPADQPGPAPADQPEPAPANQPEPAPAGQPEPAPADPVERTE